MSLSLTGPRNIRQRRRRRRRTRNRQRIQGIEDNDGGGEDLGTAIEAMALRWWSWGIGDNDGGVGRERWAQIINDDDWGVSRGSRRDYAPDRTSLTAKAAVFLWAQGIDDNNGGDCGVRWSRGLSDDDGGVGGGRLIDDATKLLETMTEAAGDWRRAWVIYDYKGVVGEGRWAQILRQRQQRSRRRIDDAYKGLETTMEAAADWWRSWWIGNDNIVLIFLTIASLTVTLSRLCLVAVSFWYCFHKIPFFIHCKKYYQYCNHAKKIVPSVH